MAVQGADVILRGAVRAQGSLTTLTTGTPRPPAVRCLDELSRGLAKEVVLWKECNDPLLYLERRAYLGAIRDALAGVEEARVLAKARH
jgi:hypothetical protein